ncbi:MULTISPECIES: deoxynucleoside kinase [Emticicia]|uniref:deoxynucleoside kinase n=1 Tax=Emticicia TaxID=312278 RepID=UPI00209F64A8|nr:MULTISPECIES: deoxynucleoside kinase [Emticicia]UTA66170.1 deoxynucleoside kinase [Emticicia sp. 21SJ11W-3]
MHIAITGNIGAGKTTLATKLAEHYGWDVLFEAVEGNPYLPPFYEDMEKWSFHLQIYFLNSRFEQVLKIKKLTEDKTIVQDRSIYEDAYIFARNLYESGKFNETDYQTYTGLFNTITQAISHPDLMIYLRADLPKLQRQILKRNRDFERNIDPAYLISLNKLYEDFVNLYTHGKLLIIDVNNLDFAENESDFMGIIDQIDKNINLGTQLEIKPL